MFVKAIEQASGFTRPIHSIARFHGTSTVVPGAATLFFVNADGWALTCKHVAEQVIIAGQLLARYNEFKLNRAKLRGIKGEKQALRNLEKQTGFRDGVVVELYNNFIDCIVGPLQVDVKLHPVLDIALLHFHGYTAISCNNFPVFALQHAELKQGKYLCRLGYPFAEFNNFQVDSTQERNVWTQSGRVGTPRFPIEGMVTRHLLDPGGAVVGFEMSTPGLRGQSGGPAFDPEARVWGMQSRTNHLDLDFDVDIDVIRNGQHRKIHHNAVLHVGHCVHVSELKSFMRQHGVSFAEG